MKVLVIDDEKDITALIQEALLMENFDVVIAYDGTEGLKKITSEDPDIIITDINMPKKSGFEVVEEIHTIKDKKWRPIIMLTAYGNHENVVKAYKNKVDYFIKKPFTLDEIIKSVHFLATLIPLRLQK